MVSDPGAGPGEDRRSDTREEPDAEPLEGCRRPQGGGDLGQGRRGGGYGAPRLHHAPARGGSRRWSSMAAATRRSRRGSRTFGEPARGALRQGFRLGHGDDRPGRPAGGEARATPRACASRQAKDAEMVEFQARQCCSTAARPNPRSRRCSTPSCRTLRRSHPRGRGARDRSISRRPARRSAREVWGRAMGDRALHHAGLRALEGRGGAYDARPRSRA